MFKNLKKMFDVQRPKIICLDDNYFNLADKITELEEKIQSLQYQIEELQRENVETTNSIYEIANSIEARIDILAPSELELKNFSLGD
jgi:predicted  nucleic acid-binding Zn-ribbon protein